MDKDTGKIAAGLKAASLIEDSMIVGLGTGSTAACFIQALINRCKAGLKIQAVASSKKSADLAISGGIKVLDINQVPNIHITVDGADEVDHQKRMIKGGGGAHVREKILAVSSLKTIIIVDESKIVKTLGITKLPIEVIPYGSNFCKKRILSLGFQGQWRLSQQSNQTADLFLTENGNYILDLYFDQPIKNPEQLEEQLLHIPGVVDTGFFFNIADLIIVGKSDGTTFNI